MMRTCPNCGYPNEQPHCIPLDLTMDPDARFDMHELKCRVCGDTGYRWMWRDQDQDGEFDWPKAEELVRKS